MVRALEASLVDSAHMGSARETLQELRAFGGQRWTDGLSDAVIERFLQQDPTLGEAIAAALVEHRALRAEWGEALAGSEAELARMVQEDFVNFYSAPTVNPYVALAARGPWIVTTHGAVVHDNGGYGMLGMGHAPQGILQAMQAPRVMANIMTPSISQKRFAQRLRREIGHTRQNGCPFARFLCVNSGSESVSVAARISDHNALVHTQKGGPRHGATIKILSLEGSFHGRTGRAAQASHSTIPRYRETLASFRDNDNLMVCPPNDVAALKAVFEQATRDNIFIEMAFLEPVMGEGNPGECVTREFYDAARALTKTHGALLLVDSIQAGFRGTGTLSLVDYPGFADCEAPDLETWSKALNAGQYPLSVLGMSERAAGLYAHGTYGNTMTSNPRALEVGCAVLDGITPALRKNIVERGHELTQKLQGLQREFPELVTHVQGTGLLVAAEMDPKRVPVVGMDGLEPWCRKRGLGVIHGGKNALRFTPHFELTSAEIDLIVDILREGLRAFA